MAFAGSADEFFTYDARVASFHTVIAPTGGKRRASTASGKGGSRLRWPHPGLKVEDLARAGFFYQPSSHSPDNVTCFLCLKSLDGWEEEDEPLAEHLKHSPGCGWAIVASIEAGNEELKKENPLDEKMVQARAATFADRWPHERKKGWKCKTKQLVDAGWKYTPTPENDDTTTCVYCELALDGWDPADKPMDEHMNRSPNCPFFTLTAQYGGKKPRAKKARASKASRASTQSNFTIAEDEPSHADLDNISIADSTEAVATQTKKTKAKAAPKTRKTKAKKNEPVEAPIELPREESAQIEPEDDDFEVKVDVAPPKPKRGKKRMSGELGETAEDTQPTKRQATHGKSAIDEEIMEDSPADQIDEEPVELVVAKGAAGRKATAKKGTRTASRTASRKVSTASTKSNSSRTAKSKQQPNQMIDNDDETRAEDDVVSQAGSIIKSEHEMFRVDVEVDEDQVEAEMEALAREEAETRSKPAPKSKARGGARKVSSQKTASKKALKAKSPEPELENEPESEPEPEQVLEEEEEESIEPPKRGRPTKSKKPAKARGSAISVASSFAASADDHRSGHESDGSNASQGTVIRKTKRSSDPKTKAATAVVREIEDEEHSDEAEDFDEVESFEEEDVVEETESVEEAQPEALKTKRDSKGKSRAVEEPSEEPIEQATEDFEEYDETFEESVGLENHEPELEEEPEEEAEEEAEEEPEQDVPLRATVDFTLPTPQKKTPVKELTPSPSPQSSDAENQPPSSRPGTGPTPPGRVPLAPIAVTPTGSPSRRNVMKGMQSTHPWTDIDVENLFFKSPQKENLAGAGLLNGAFERARTGELTSPEKKMTVEEWIVYNADIAEERLKTECERMVGLFESQGTRAMQTLEGLQCTE